VLSARSKARERTIFREFMTDAPRIRAKLKAPLEVPANFVLVIRFQIQSSPWQQKKTPGKPGVAIALFSMITIHTELDSRRAFVYMK